MSLGSVYEHSYEGEGLGRYALRSFFAHIAFITVGALLTLSFDFFGDSSLSDKNIDLIEASVRVDVVAMPKMTVKELQSLQRQASQSSGNSVEKKVEKSAPPKVKKIADDSKAPVLNESKKNSSVSDILKQAALQKTESLPTSGQPSKDEGISDKARDQLRSLVAAGNKISEGSSISGAGNSAEQATAFNGYISQLPELVRPNWRLPSYLMDKNLRCRIRIYLSENGELLKAEIYETSGNEEYDERALKAVRESSPFPPLDNTISSRAVKGQILLGFPL
jgi:TonB family protein